MRNGEIRKILSAYQKLLQGVDGWFNAATASSSGMVQCGKGCAQCCRGLFDITLLDAWLLKDAFERLPADCRRQALPKAQSRMAELESRWPDFALPYILNRLPHEEWTEMPEDDPTPCPLLDADGNCLVYEARPMTCRLHGLPHVDISGEVFSDQWCTMNFIGEDPMARRELRGHFRSTFLHQLLLMREMTGHLVGFPVHEVDTFIPAALLVDYASCDWKSLGLRPFEEKANEV